MTKKKIAIAIAAAALAGTCAIGGTLAWLTASTDVVTNTFTVGDVAITLDEPSTTDVDPDTSGTQIKLSPGLAVTKDPTVTVTANSEDCYVFVTLNDTTNDVTIGNWNNKNWVEITDLVNADENQKVFRYNQIVENSESDTVLPELFGTVTLDEDFNGEIVEGNMDIKAYAIQSLGSNNANMSWQDAYAKLGSEVPTFKN